MRTVAVAIDAAEWWYMERLVRAGRLPHLARLLERGVHCRLQNEFAYRSETVWARFLTGREPLEDKEWPGCTTFDPATYAHGSRGASLLSPFYAGTDLKVIAFDLIHSSLAEDVKGTQVTAWGAHSPQYPRASIPKGLLTEIDQRFGTNPAFGNDFDLGWYHPGYMQRLTDALLVGARRRLDIAAWLADTVPDWDLLLTCMSEIHSGGHHFWHGVDSSHPLHGAATSDLARSSCDAVAEATDAAMGRFFAQLPPETNVVVFALHGMVPADDVAATVLLPEILHRQHFGTGLLRSPDPSEWRRAGCPPLQPRLDESWGSYMGDRFVDGRGGRLRNVLAETLPPTMIASMRRALRKPDHAPGARWRETPPEVEVTPALLATYEKPYDFQVLTKYERYWPAMRAFALPNFADGHVRINLEGREAGGTVPRSSYATACDEVIQLLRDCRDARTGTPVVEDVIWMRRDDPFDADGPDADLLIAWRGAPDAVEHPELGVIGPFPALRTGFHSANGFMVASGPGIEGRDLGVRPAQDVTATLLDLLDVHRPVVGGTSVFAGTA